MLAHPCLDRAYRGRSEPERGVKDDPGRPGGGAGGREHAVEDAAMKVQVLIQRRAEAVDEDHCAQPGRGAAAGTVLAQAGLDGAQQDAHDHALQRRIVVQEIAQPLRYGKHPLPQRQRRQHVIDEVRRGLHHAPGIARWADGPAMAGKGNQEVVPARSAMGARKAIRKDAAFEITAKGLLDIGRRCRRVGLGRERQPRLEVCLDKAIPQGVFGMVTLITPGAGGRRFDCGRHRRPRGCGSAEWARA